MYSEAFTSSESSARKLGTILVIIVIMGISGAYFWLQVGPEHNARLWLDKTSVSRGESLRLNIRNLGAGWIEPDFSYKMFREYENGTIEDMIKWDFAKTAPMRELRLFGSYSQIINTRLDPGEYYVIKGYRVNGMKRYSRALYFTVRALS